MKKIMKTKIQLLQWLMLLLLSTSTVGVWAQTATGPQEVCISPQPYLVTASSIPGATYIWSITPGASGTEWQITGTGNSIIIDWLLPGVYTVEVYTSANGCNGPPQSVQVTVYPQPVGPTLLAQTPPGPSVCEGTQVSATFNPGSGGVGCSDEFQYSYDGLGVWVIYTPGNPIITTGHTLVEIQGRRTCPSTALGCNGTNWVTLATWNITPLPSATINYAGNPFCTSANPVNVTLTGTTGGVFTAPVGLTIDPVTGTITPATSTPGNYTVTYTIAASGGCAEFTTTADVTITVAPSATISYAGTPFCTSAGPGAVTLTGTPGGTYSAAPAGLTIDPLTGTITPATSTPGVYTVTYTIAASGGCTEFTTTTSVTINEVPTTSPIFHN
jgi:hypothetical protein